MEQKHTTGPWSSTVFAAGTALPGFPAGVYALDRENGEKETEIDTGSYLVCDFDDTERDSLPQQLADARLIAAAPDLLAILEQCQSFLEDACRPAKGGDSIPSLWSRGLMLEAATRAAIAKAKGEAHAQL